MLNKQKLTGAIVTTLLLLGCGADSDLLEDSHVNKTPEGAAYDIYAKDFFEYKTVPNESTGAIELGFSYLRLGEECNTKECLLIESLYRFENDESTNIPLQKNLILSDNGWFDKSQVEECSLDFSGSKVKQYCPDGRDLTIYVAQSDLEGKGLRSLHQASLYVDKIKDPEATFTHNSKRIELGIENQHTVYETVESALNRCKASDGSYARNDNNLIEHSELNCKFNGLKLSFSSVPSESGTVLLNDGASGSATWTRKTINNRYIVLETSAINGQSYFISAYNSYIYTGNVTPKTMAKEYINTEAFNVIYTQLKDEIKK